MRWTSDSAKITYLDYNATTPLRPEALAAMEPYMRECFGNPSSAHRLGSRARTAVEEARHRVAQVFGVRSAEVVFTSGGTESNHLAILGMAQACPPGTILTTPIEHSSVLRPVAWLREHGWQVHYVALHSDGRVNLDDLEESLRESDVRFVSVGWANNETGTLQPVETIYALCRQRGVPFHCDGVQVPGKVPVSEVPADLMSVSAHKFGGPKGSGCLIARRGVRLEPLLRGGAQERGLRAGTENVAGIVGLATALELSAKEAENFATKTRRLRDLLWTRLAGLPGIERHGGVGCHALPNTLMVTVAGTSSDALIAALDLDGICVSAGSACAAGASEPSHVLVALGVSEELARGAIRFSLGPDLEERDVEFVAERFWDAVKRIRNSECRAMAGVRG
ncbi:MAG: cysteine desulfurase IscS [Candidatus Binatia bacterium]|nr:MAG: cysteine desulfurase IscS [Candidatus Binatia bacterium]